MKQLQITLTPSESKRLIAKSIKNLPIIKNALKKGLILINLGTTNAFLVEELLGKKIEKAIFSSGIIDGRTCIVPKDKRCNDILIENGKIVDKGEKKEDTINRLSSGDVFIKGANAIDSHGVAGIMLANSTGGTIGMAIGPIMAKGVNFVIPVGLEKMVFGSIIETSKHVGTERFDKSIGIPVGIVPVHGTVITEIEALKLLGAEEVYHIGSGGIGGAEGSVTLCVKCKELEKIADYVLSIKGEKNILSEKMKCADCEIEACVYFD